MTRARTLAAAAVLALGAPAFAADPSPAAAELARIIMPKQTWSDGVQQIASGLQGQMQSHPGATLHYPPDFGAKLRAEVENALPYEALLSIHAQQLAAGFSEPELKDLVAFYKSPTGQKALKTMPAVSEKVAQETQQRVEKQLPGIMTRMSELVKAPADAKAKPAKPAEAAKPAPPAAK
jgi:hypothetical protein